MAGYGRVLRELVQGAYHGSPAPLCSKGWAKHSSQTHLHPGIKRLGGDWCGKQAKEGGIQQQKSLLVGAAI